MHHPAITLSMLQRQLISLAFAFLLITLPAFPPTLVKFT